MKTIYLNSKEFNSINKVLLNAGRKDIAYDLIRNSVNSEDNVIIPEIDDDFFDLIVKLLIISDDENDQHLGYKLVDNKK